MKKNAIVVTVVVIVLLIILFVAGPFYILEEGEQVVITRFGKIEDSTTTAGLKFKMPMIDTVVKYTKKMLSWDGQPQRIPTQENQFIWVDTTARWKISDPVKFYESSTTMERGFARLDNIIDSAVRTVIAKNPLREAVRNSNVINEIERKEVIQGLEQESGTDLEQFTNVSVKFETVVKGRRQLSEEMLALVKDITPQYGIEIIDIIIRQIRYSDDLTESVYQRMIKERNQRAQAFRSYGEGKKREWLGSLDKEKRTILSTAYAQAEKIKGEADALAADIYAKAYQQDPSFYDFWRAVESYKQVVPNFKKTLTTDMDYFKYLYSQQGR